MQTIKRTIDPIMRRPENIIVLIGAMLAALTILYGVSRFGSLKDADRETIAHVPDGVVRDSAVLGSN